MGESKILPVERGRMQFCAASAPLSFRLKSVVFKREALNIRRFQIVKSFLSDETKSGVNALWFDEHFWNV